MRVSTLFCLVAGVIPVLSSAIKPYVAREVKYVDVPQPRHIDIYDESIAYIEGRSLHLGQFNLAQTIPPGKVLVSASVGTSAPGQASASLSITATCISCFTTGTADVSTDGLKIDWSDLNPINFIKHPDPTDLVAKAVDMPITVNLNNLGGHFELKISFAASGTYVVPIFKSETPIGVQLKDDAKIGLLMSIDLILSVSASIDFTAGFDLVFPNGISYVLDPISGEIIEMSLGGMQVKEIPVKFKSGAASFTAVLRIKFEAGLGLKVLGKGFDFAAGVFFDPLQYAASISYDPARVCALDMTQKIFAEVGAYAKAGVTIDPVKLNIGPTAVTTFFTGTLASTCISSGTGTATAKILATSKPSLPASIKDVSSKIQQTTLVSKTSQKETGKPTETTIKLATSPTGAIFHPTGTTSHANGVSTVKSVKPSGTGIFSIPHHVHGSGSGVPPVYASVSGKPIPYGNSSHPTSHGVTVAQNSGVNVPLTTSTISLTSVYTIASCKPEVTDCPARIGKVTSEIIVTTTVYPVSTSAPKPTSASVAQNSGVNVPMTTSTISSTKVYTITSCKPEVTDCPSRIGKVTSEVFITTTVCPVSTGSPKPVVSSSVAQNSGVAVSKSSSVPSAIPTYVATGGTPYSPPFASSIVISSPPPSPTASELTTRTIYNTESVTITSCQSAYVFCPTHLAVPVVQTIQIVQYTTVCPVDQTAFPSVLPTPVPAPIPSPVPISVVSVVPIPIAGSTTVASNQGVAVTTAILPPGQSVPTFAPTISINNPYTMTPLSTPIVKTLDSYVPPVPTATFAANTTLPIPTTLPPPVKPTSYPITNLTASYVAPSSKGTAPFTSLPVATGKPSIPAFASASSKPQPSLIQTSGAGTLVATSVVMVLAGAFMGFLV